MNKEQKIKQEAEWKIQKEANRKHNLAIYSFGLKSLPIDKILRFIIKRNMKRIGKK
jgi:hypothetical protein